MTGCRHAKRPTTSRETWNSLLGAIWAEAKERRRLLVLQSDADFIQMSEDIGRVLIDPIGSGALQLIPAIAPGEQSHREGERGRAASKSQTLSPTMTQRLMPTFSRFPAATNRSGSGFAKRTSSRVITGTFS